MAIIRACIDGILFPIHIDTSKSTFEILDDNSLTLEEAVNQNQNDMKMLLKKKWKQVEEENGKAS